MELKGTRKHVLDGVEVFGEGWPAAWERSLKMVNHSPTGPEWGYYGSGPAQLALAILLWAGVDEAIADRQYMHYKSEIVSSLPHEEWVITSEAVVEWSKKLSTLGDPMSRES